jgi:hypothetical protein
MNLHLQCGILIVYALINRYNIFQAFICRRKLYNDEGLYIYLVLISLTIHAAFSVIQYLLAAACSSAHTATSNHYVALFYYRVLCILMTNSRRSKII